MPSTRSSARPARLDSVVGRSFPNPFAVKYHNAILALAALAAAATAASRAAAQNPRSIGLIAPGAAQIPDSARKKHVTSFTGDLGFVSASGNTNVTTLTMGDRIVRTDGYWMFTQVGTYVSSETNNKQSANQLRVMGR